MEEIDFMNNEPYQDGAKAQQQPVVAQEKAPSSKPEEIRSAEYTDIKPFFESRYGNSRLFTAQHNGQKVIIKTLKADRANNAQCRASLRNEYDIASTLDNKHVRKALDCVTIQGLGDCIILEYIEGKSLAEHVRVGTLSEKQVKSILVEICDALTYLHRNQIIHSNLKPENILVTANDCRVKLIDIGVPETNPDADRELLIKEMEFVAPEIIKGEDIDPRADIYSLGKIMEFIGERNISKHYVNVATHSTQFSKEQRYDSVSEVKSAISKGHSLLAIILISIIVLLGILAYLYVPKIKANVEKERAERMAVDFAREMDNMQKELPALQEKYKLTSLDEQIAPVWTDDSLRFAKNLKPFFGVEGYQSQALNALNEQKQHIEKSRQQDFDQLLLSEFKAANDSIALQLKSALTDPTDALLLTEARKWRGQNK